MNKKMKKKITRVKELIELLEHLPENALVTVHTGYRLDPLELVYLDERNTVVFQKVNEEKNNEIDE